MTTDVEASEPRKRGSIRRMGAVLQVRVSAGKDPSTGERIVLVESVAIAKPGNERSERAAINEAERTRTRLLAEADSLKVARTVFTSCVQAVRCVEPDSPRLEHHHPTRACPTPFHLHPHHLTPRAWDVSDPHRPSLLTTLTGHTDTVESAAFSPDGHTLAPASVDDTARLWDSNVDF